jgi:hypothetical protein
MPRAPPNACLQHDGTHLTPPVARHSRRIQRSSMHRIHHPARETITMHTTQKRSLSMFRRVRELLATDADNATIASPLAELDGIIARLSDFGITQDTLNRRTRSFTIHIAQQARTLRRDLLRPAALAARTVYPSLGNGALALRTAMRMPKKPGDYEGLIVAANAFANAVDEHSAAFVAAGLPREFAGRMRAAAEELMKAVDTRSRDEQRRIAATQGLASESRRGAALVRLLDALVEPTLRTDPARAAEWQKATRIRSFVPAGGSSVVSEVPDIPAATPAATLEKEVTPLAA